MSLCEGQGELLCFGEECFIIFGEQVCDFSLQRVIRIWVLQQSDDTFNDEFGVEGGDPVVFDCLSADLSSVLLDVRVEDLGLE